MVYAMKSYRQFSVCCFLLTLFALSASAQPVASDHSPLKIEKAWIQAVPEVSDATAAYMRITNLSTSTLRLTGGYSPVATTVEPMITTRKVHDGQEIMGMQTTEELLIPAGSSLELKPGGDHLMIMGLSVKWSPPGLDRKSTRLNSSHSGESRMPSSA